ncbi:hypothetical protein [Streptomyces sp. enrichment culture]|uniref:hypothetical protein n=1 Tax=Streptomyces sp. enrichment culture TaxID=1795815 RepID=UPI003F564359
MLLALLAFLAAAIGVIAAFLGLLGAVLPGRPEPWRWHVPRRAAQLAAAGAAAVYFLGLADVAASDYEVGKGTDSVPAPACRDDEPPETVHGLIDHRVSYLPPAFTCVREDGSTYAADPAYAWRNPAAAGLALSAAALAVAARASRPHVRRAAPAAPDRPGP